MAPLFLDSNIFLYAMGTEHTEKAPSTRLLELVAEGRIEGVTSSEVLREVLYVRLRNGSRKDALAAVRHVHDIVHEVLPVQDIDVLAACDLLFRYPSLDSRDAIHAAVAKNHGLTAIVTVDGDFERIKGLRRLSPAQAAA